MSAKVDSIVAAYTGQEARAVAALPVPSDGLRTVAGPKKVNPQLFENNSLSQSTEGTDYYKSENGLFGDRPPNLAIKHERPEHRLIVYLKATGMTNQEIATKTGYGYQWICQLVRQPWFRENFIRECEASGRDAISSFLEGEMIPSLETLVEIRDNVYAKEASRVAASNSLLDRFLGKPTQKVETESTSKGLDDARKTVDELEAQVNELRKQNGLAEFAGESN
jgi:hypothetical protein